MWTGSRWVQFLSPVSGLDNKNPWKWLILLLLQVKGLALVFQRLDGAIRWTNNYPADNYQGNQLRYPLNRFLSGWWHYPTFEQPGLWSLSFAFRRCQPSGNCGSRPRYPGSKRIFFFYRYWWFAAKPRQRGAKRREKKITREPYQTRKHGLFHIRYFDNGPLEPGYDPDDNLSRIVCSLFLVPAMARFLV